MYIHVCTCSGFYAGEFLVGVSSLVLSMHFLFIRKKSLLNNCSWHREFKALNCHIIYNVEGWL